MQSHLNFDTVNLNNKLVIIKANKIEAFSNDYYSSTPTKNSHRKNSLLNNSTSRSKSKSKSKPLRFDDLNQSNNSYLSFYVEPAVTVRKASKAIEAAQ